LPSQLATPNLPDGKLGDALARTYVQAASFPENIAESMRLLRKATEASPIDEPFYAYCVDRLTWAHGYRWDRFDEEHDIVERVRLCEENVARRPPGSEERFSSLENLITALLQRAKVKHETITFLDRGIGICKQALDEATDDVTQRPIFYKHLLELFYARYDITKANEDFDHLIDAVRSYCALSSDRKARSALANALALRSLRTYAQTDINEPIQLLRQIVDELPQDDPYLREETSGLARAYHNRFIISGDVDDVDEAISLTKKALSLTPADHSLRPRQLREAVLYKRMKSDLLKDPDVDNLEERILLIKEAVSLCPPNNAQRGESLHYLAYEINTKYVRLHRSEDLEQVISLLEEAISQPLSDDERIQASCSVANALLSRHRLQKEPGDLDRTVTLSEEAVHPDNFADSDEAVQSHVRALFERFNSSKLSEDLEEAIRIQVKYVDSLSIQERAEALVLLSRLHVARGRLMPVKGNQDTDDLATAVSMLEMAMEHERTFPRWLLVEICEGLADFTHLGNLRADVQRSLLSIYRKLLELLPRVASFNLSVRSRLSVLLDARSLAAQAALCALSIGEVPDALELLEDGHGTFWTQGLQLHTQLEDVPPELRDRLEQLSDELEQGSLSPAAAGNLDPGVVEATHQLQAVRRRRTAAEFEAAVAHVQTIPGLERFMLPTSAGLLARAATRNSVVTLIAGEEGCHAIIIAPTGEVQHVPLSTINTERLIKIAEHLRQDQFGTRTARAARIARLKTSFGHHQLRLMWQAIVLPVLKALDARVSEQKFLSTFKSDVCEVAQGERTTRTPVLVCRWCIHLHPGTRSRRLWQSS
jgi:tetratricopeptide (TPR) repeat protein